MIKKLLDALLGADNTSPPKKNDLDLAAAALMVEVMRADHDIDLQEKNVLQQQLKALFGLNDDQTASLLESAQEVSHEATDLYQFTEQVHQSFSDLQKFHLLTGLWKVAYASDGIDRYEEHIIRRIAELLYIPHSEFIRAKHEARNLP